MIVTTQLPVENWQEILPDPVLCEAITDRIFQKAIMIEMQGDSYRKKTLQRKPKLIHREIGVTRVKIGNLRPGSLS